MNNQKVIQLENVVKKFKKTTLLEGINLSIYKGQSVALVGHNGVGKSTLLRIIAGLSSIEGGKVIYDEKLLFHYVPEQFPRSNLTVMMYLDLMSRIDGFDKNERQELIQTFLADFFMSHMADTPLNFLSKGSLQKVGVIQALLSTPDVLLLDEPLSGQDAKSQRVFIQKMKDLLADGMTILMSCHEKYLMNEIADMIVEIKDGQIEVGGVEKVEVADEFVLTFVDEKGDLNLPQLDYPVDRKEHSIRIYVDVSRTDEVISAMMACGWSLRGMAHV